MLLTLKICVVSPDPAHERAFINALRPGGLLYQLAREHYPANSFGTTLLRSRSNPSVFAILDSWMSAEDYARAQSSLAFLTLERFCANLTMLCLGPVAVSARIGREKTSTAISVTPESESSQIFNEQDPTENRTERPHSPPVVLQLFKLRTDSG